MEQHEGLLRLRKVLELVPVGKSNWYQGVREGRYPQPVRLGTRVSVWRAKDIYDFIKSLPTVGLGEGDRDE